MFKTSKGTDMIQKGNKDKKNIEVINAMQDGQPAK